MKNHLKFTITLIISQLIIYLIWENKLLSSILNMNYYVNYFDISLDGSLIYSLPFFKLTLLPFIFSLYKNKGLETLFEIENNTFKWLNINFLIFIIVNVIQFVLFFNPFELHPMYERLIFVLGLLEIVLLLSILILFYKNKNFTIFLDTNRLKKFITTKKSLIIAITCITMLLIFNILQEIVLLNSNILFTFQDIDGFQFLVKNIMSNYVNYTLYLGLLPFLWILYKNIAFINLIDTANGKLLKEEEPFVVYFLVGIVILFYVSSLIPIVYDLLFTRVYIIIIALFVSMLSLVINQIVKKKYYLATSTFVIFLLILGLFVQYYCKISIK